MSSITPIPEDVKQLVANLTRGLEAKEQQLAAIARWRLACGDAHGSARWHRWCVQPPEADVLKASLQQLLLLVNQPDLAKGLGHPIGWEGVILALTQNDLTAARQLQQQASASGQGLDLALALHLASLWQQLGDSTCALALLEPIANRKPNPNLFNAIAHLHEQRQALDLAALWWDRSLELDHHQPGALMQRCRNALAQSEPALAFQTIQQLMQLDPHHVVGQELRVEALQQLRARASLRLALVPLVRERRERYRRQARELASWWRPRRRHQRTWRQEAPLMALRPLHPVPAEALLGCRQVGLLASKDGLELVNSLDRRIPDGVVWDLQSREPLCSQRNLLKLLPEGWLLKTWYCWHPMRHGPLEALVIADPRQSVPPHAPKHTLQWQQRWQRHP